ncbi:nucleotide exchange factor GrpE [Candidatus Tisiphia endosymbiont of Ptychoptera albimana]
MLQDSLQEIASLKNQIEILQDKLLRTIAESDNTRKRLEKSIEEARDYAIFSFAKDLLSVNDNLSRALEHKPQNMEGDIANIITGVEMTKGELTSILQKHGLESIEPLLGEKFDYNIHHAISQILSDEYDQDSVIAVMQSGYKIKDRLLRPATVQVSKRI